jgi:hypothetical protein
MTLSKKVIYAAGFVSLLGLAMPSLAKADPRGWARDWPRPGVRYENSALAELRRDQSELRRDQLELARDRADLERLYRSGASQQQIIRKRQEIRNDLKEVAQDHREISESLEALSWDRRRAYGQEAGWAGRDRWGRFGNNGWGWGGAYGRDRWSREDFRNGRFGRD